MSARAIGSVIFFCRLRAIIGRSGCSRRWDIEVGVCARDKAQCVKKQAGERGDERTEGAKRRWRHTRISSSDDKGDVGPRPGGSRRLTRSRLSRYVPPEDERGPYVAASSWWRPSALALRAALNVQVYLTSSGVRAARVVVFDGRRAKGTSR